MFIVTTIVCFLCYDIRNIEKSITKDNSVKHDYVTCVNKNINKIKTKKLSYISKNVNETIKNINKIIEDDIKKSFNYNNEVL